MKLKRLVSSGLIGFILLGYTPVLAEETEGQETTEISSENQTETEAQETENGEVTEQTPAEEPNELETVNENTEVTEETVTEEVIITEETEEPEELIELGEVTEEEVLPEKTLPEESAELIEEEVKAEEEVLAAPVNVFLVLEKAKAFSGSEEISVKELEAGKQITITADKPASGYRFAGWKFADSNGKEVKKDSLKIISEKDLSITFEVPETPLKITALYEASGKWKHNDKGWWYEWNGSYLKKTWRQIDGKWYYFKEDGYRVTGWLKQSDKWYWFDSAGAMVTGWRKISGKWYFFDKDGVMKTGWLKNSGKWYWLNDSGAMVYGWKEISSKWYWFDSTGAMVTGWQKIGGVWYYMHNSGAMARGWEKLNGKWYFLDRSSGAMKTGWVKDGNTWYWLRSDGSMYSGGWETLGGKWYWFKSSGAMATGWLKYGGAWYYLDSSGAMVSDQIRAIGNKAYHFEVNGVMTTGWKTYGSMKFHFDETNGWVTEMYHNGVPYYSQRDGRWGDVQYGSYNPIKNTGCAPTSGAMVVNYLKGTNYTPADIAGLFYSWGDYNANYGHGTGSTAWRKFAKHFGLSFQNSMSFSDMVGALKAGKMMIITVGYDGKYVVGNYTHTMCFYGYDSAGRTYVHDPFNDANNGWIDAKSLYNRATNLWLDNVDGGPLYAFSR